jgi:hypothetical protein
MTANITQIQVWDDSEDLVCTITAFDCDSYTVKWEHEIHTAEELRYVADLINSKIIYEVIE